MGIAMRRVPAAVLLLLIPNADALAEATPSDAGQLLELSASYVADLLANVDGGLRTGEAWVDKLSVAADLRFGDPGEPGRMSVHAFGFMTNAATFSERYVGDVMTLSNIDNGYALQVLELWGQWELGAARDSSLRVGLYDLNSEFDSIDTRGLFINSAHGLGHELAQTGVNGPSTFPYTGLAARFAWQPRESVRVLVAALDAVPAASNGLDADRFRLSRDEGALLIAQASVAAGPFALLGLGHWEYTEPVDPVPVGSGPPPTRTARNGGTYLKVETVPFGGTTSWRAFGRVGYADPDLNEFDLHLAAGLVRDLAWPTAAGSTLGLAVQGTHPGDRYSRDLATRGLEARTEKAFELTWKVAIGDHLTLQPDVQFIDDPAGDPDARDAWVVGLRIGLAADW
jgi:porin